MLKPNKLKMSMKQLRVLHINKFHYMKGGSEMVYFGTVNALERHGHRSIFFSMHHPENLPCETSEYFMPHVDFNRCDSVISQLKVAGRVLYSLKAKRLLSKLLDRNSVDIAHLHNIHHQISASILHELKKRQIPVVMTLHDYKMVCASYNMLVHERPCEVCARGKYFKAIKYKCVKDSFIKSTLATIEMYLHHKIFNIYDNVDVFISPSVFLKNKLLEMGFGKEIIYLPNFVDIQKFEEFKIDVKDDKWNSIVYFGRLAPGKGLLTLLEAAKRLSCKNRNNAIEIKLIGDGPMKEELEEKVKAEKINNVRFLGYLKGKELFQEIKKSLAAVLPSEWYENNPISVIEAFALCKPVVGARIAGVPELVKDNETGLTFEPENHADLSLKIEYLKNNPDKAGVMGRNARVFVEQELNTEKYYQKLMEIYRRTIVKRHSESNSFHVDDF